MPYADAFDEREPLATPLLASLALHGGVLVLVTAASVLNLHTQDHWRGKESMGGSFRINPVIDLPSRTGIVNPVANDTESQAPQAPPKPKPVQKAKEPEPDAIPIKSRTSPKKASRVEASTGRYRPYTEPKPNQVYSSTGGALVSPMMGRTGSGGVGIGMGTPLGDRFGAYAALLQQIVAQKWRMQEIDPRLSTAPPAIVTCTILRDGTIKDIRVKTSSGNGSLDRSAERALYDVARFDPLPAAYERDRAEIEFWFQLKR
ncbi:MAG TPA: energy transducer TonB [Candidatus Solibacter sp.]|nr:energy transducer TonB [Candidatus Solibacter sp.]